jgi:hypothetical protein
MDTRLCNPYVWEHPASVLHTDLTWKSRRGGCASDLTNHVLIVFTIAVAFGLYSSHVQHHSAAFVGCLVIATLYCTPAFIALLRLRAHREGFQAVKEEPTPVVDVIGSVGSYENTNPSNRNPFMNVLLDEIKYNPGRGTAASVMDPLTKVQLDDFFRTDFASDPTDVFGKTQSQRQFITMPSTSIPNDQGSYQNWLYKIPGKTCKEGGREACMPGTDGGALPWLNVDR